MDAQLYKYLGDCAAQLMPVAKKHQLTLEQLVLLAQSGKDGAAAREANDAAPGLATMAPLPLRLARMTPAQRRERSAERKTALRGRVP